MIELLTELMPTEQILPTKVKGVTLFRRDRPMQRRHQMYESQIIILAQGEKNIFHGEDIFHYDAMNYVTVAVPLAMECEAIISDGKPILGMALDVDPQMIGEIALEMDFQPARNVAVVQGVFGAPIGDSMKDAAVRLLNSLKSDDDSKILGPLYYKEILYRILSSENGAVLEALVNNNRGFVQVAKAINTIHTHFYDPIDIQELAQNVGMSASSFYANFKAMTNTSPLQYIKKIRLLRAKALIQKGEKVYSAALHVGYESASQFNREYKRFFGVTPAKDSVEIARF